MSREVTDRLKILQKRLFEEFHQKKTRWGDELNIFDKEGVEELPLIKRKALAFEQVCQKMPIHIYPAELIVGTPTLVSIGLGVSFPRYETDEEAAHYAQFGLSRKSIFGHHLPYYSKVLQKGYVGIIQEIDEELQKMQCQDKEGRDFLEAAKHCLEAACELSERYGILADELAEKEPSQVRRAELIEIACICRKVPKYPPESFREALQSVWFVHMLLHTTMTMTPMGSIDQYLWPYYEVDEKAGKITQEEALELIGSFWIKFNELIQYEGAMQKGPEGKALEQNANHWLQSATLSGRGADGKDRTNTLSYMFLRSINDLELVSPMINARTHENSPKEWLDFIAEELSEGGAQPVVYNDDVICKGLIERLGICPEDAWNYCTDGCWEVLMEGQSDYYFDMVDLLLCMEALLNRGRIMNTGDLIGKDMGEDVLNSLDTFEKFYVAFVEQVHYRMDELMKRAQIMYREIGGIAPEPFLSSMMCDCVKNHRDLTRQGTKYTLYSFMATGMSHCVDTLSAIKRVVYEEKKVSLEQVAQILRDNWDGHEQLRQYCLNKTPKYGNDDDVADDILVRFVDDFCDKADEWNAKLEWMKVTAGIATFENYVRHGWFAGASFDGRFAREPLSSNYSPAVGRDRQGLTAAILSSAKPNLSRMNSGGPVDLRISFQKQTREECVDILKGLVRSFREVGGMMMTLTKVDRETLLKAQKEPEKYQSLRVRLGGVTVYFVQLDKEQQAEYMRRTEHTM